MPQGIAVNQVSADFGIDLQIREGLEVTLSALGIDAPCVAMRAVCHARGYLEVSPIQHC